MATDRPVLYIQPTRLFKIYETDGINDIKSL